MTQQTKLHIVSHSTTTNRCLQKPLPCTLTSVFVSKSHHNHSSNFNFNFDLSSQPTNLLQAHQQSLPTSNFDPQPPSTMSAFLKNFDIIGAPLVVLLSFSLTAGVVTGVHSMRSVNNERSIQRHNMEVAIPDAPEETRQIKRIPHVPWPGSKPSSL